MGGPGVKTSNTSDLNAAQSEALCESLFIDSYLAQNTMEVTQKDFHRYASNFNLTY